MILNALIHGKWRYLHTLPEMLALVGVVMADLASESEAPFYDPGEDAKFMLSNRRHTGVGTDWPNSFLQIAVNVSSGYGGLNWFVTEGYPEKEGIYESVWVSDNLSPPDFDPRVVSDPGESAFYDPRSAVPIFLVRQAVEEFCRTGTGQRPECVSWVRGYANGHRLDAAVRRARPGRRRTEVFLVGNGPIHVPVGSQVHRWLQCVGDADFDALKSADLQSRVSSSWRLQVRLITKDEHGAPLRDSGLLWLSSHVLAMTEAVRDVVGPMMEDHGVFAPLRSDDGDFWIFVPGICDALSEAGSSVTRFSSGRVMYVSRYDFHPDRLVGRTVFRIPQLPKGPLFCTQRVVDALSTKSGVGFQQVWPAPGQLQA